MFPLKEEYLTKINESLERVQKAIEKYKYEVFIIQIEEVTSSEVYAFIITDREISTLDGVLDFQDFQDFQEIGLNVIAIPIKTKIYLAFMVSLK